MKGAEVRKRPLPTASDIELPTPSAATLDDIADLFGLTAAEFTTALELVNLAGADLSLFSFSQIATLFGATEEQLLAAYSGDLIDVTGVDFSTITLAELSALLGMSEQAIVDLAGGNVTTQIIDPATVDIPSLSMGGLSTLLSTDSKTLSSSLVSNTPVADEKTIDNQDIVEFSKSIVSPEEFQKNGVSFYQNNGYKTLADGNLYSAGSAFGTKPTTLQNTTNENITIAEKFNRGLKLLSLQEFWQNNVKAFLNVEVLSTNDIVYLFIAKVPKNSTNNNDPSIELFGENGIYSVPSFGNMDLQFSNPSFTNKFYFPITYGAGYSSSTYDYFLVLGSMIDTTEVSIEIISDVELNGFKVSDPDDVSGAYSLLTSYQNDYTGNVTRPAIFTIA